MSFFSNEQMQSPDMRYFGEVILNRPGFGTRCMVDEPLVYVHMHSNDIKEHPKVFVQLTMSIFVSHRDYPCNNITTEWEMPLVNPALIEMLDNPEWTDINPSPSCQCSTPNKLTMLPVCPEGAGGLPPPQVCLSAIDTTL